MNENLERLLSDAVTNWSSRMALRALYLHALDNKPLQGWTEKLNNEYCLIETFESSRQHGEAFGRPYNGTISNSIREAVLLAETRIKAIISRQDM